MIGRRIVSFKPEGASAYNVIGDIRTFVVIDDPEGMPSSTGTVTMSCSTFNMEPERTAFKMEPERTREVITVYPAMSTNQYHECRKIKPRKPKRLHRGLR